MLKNILLIIKKLYLGRYSWMTVLTVGFILLFLPLFQLQIQPKVSSSFYRLDLYSLWCVALVYAYCSIYGDTSSMFSMRYNKTGVMGVLPVTRLEVIAARYIFTFTGVLVSSIVLFIFSETIGNSSVNKSGISFSSLSVLLPSFLLVIVFVDLLLLLAGFMQNTAGMYVLSIAFSFPFAIISGIAMWVFSNLTLNVLQLTAIALAAVLVTITTAALNYKLYKKQPV